MTRRLKTLSVVLAAAMAVTAVGSQRLQPSHLIAVEHKLVLESMVPTEFGDWHMVSDGHDAIVDPSVQNKLAQLYSQLLERSYVNADGYVIMLAIAYGNEQRRMLAAHRPDVCYPAQGFTVGRTSQITLPTPFGGIAAERMSAHKGTRAEPVTFWFTMGGATVRNSIDRRLVSLKYSLTGEIPDGLLFRVSSIDPDEAHGYAAQQAFVTALSAVLSPEARTRLAGLKQGL